MRRGFKKSLLPKEAPKKGKYYTQGKSKERKSAMLRILLWDWRRQFGEDFDLEDFAKAIGVHKGTAKRYFYGYPPHKDYHWPIARYFAPHTNCTEEILFEDIRSTYEDFKAS